MLIGGALQRLDPSWPSHDQPHTVGSRGSLAHLQAGKPAQGHLTVTHVDHQPALPTRPLGVAARTKQVPDRSGPPRGRAQ